jgi:hypothetical protein
MEEDHLLALLEENLCNERACFLKIRQHRRRERMAFVCTVDVKAFQHFHDFRWPDVLRGQYEVSRQQNRTFRRQLPAKNEPLRGRAPALEIMGRSSCSH